MMLQCSLCGALVAGPARNEIQAQLARDPNFGPAAVLELNDETMQSLSYQAAVMHLHTHVVQAHPDQATAHQMAANAYLFQLAAKLAVSTDPDFAYRREEERRLLYWTLNGAVHHRPEPAEQKPALILPN